MIFITTALQSEARPLTRELGLKKYDTGNKFRIYHSNDFVLCVTGTGKIKSAVSTTFTLTQFKACYKDYFINAGVCGAISHRSETGTIFLATCIRDHDTGKSYYPDILIGHPFREGILETFSRPVSDIHEPAPLTDIVDMEGAAVFEAAAAFIPAHHIFILKTVLDNIDPTGFTGRNVEEVMKGAAPRLRRFAQSAGDILSSTSDTPYSEFLKRIETTPGFQCLSATMKIDLKSLVRYALLSNNQLAAELINETAANFQNISCRKDAKKLVSDLKNSLCSVPLEPGRH